MIWHSKKLLDYQKDLKRGLRRGGKGTPEGIPFRESDEILNQMNNKRLSTSNTVSSKLKGPLVLSH